MKQKDIAQLSVAELRERLTEEQGMLSKMKLNHQVSPIENPMKIRATRRTIARLQTEISKRNANTATK
ncbi:MAG: 50S ribosomal protein L29 [Bacteroidia bacterium]|jgi:large subunit ribosomal protein L29|nr:50S ribosomal protein L29 [Bacteroidia bacterium]